MSKLGLSQDDHVYVVTFNFKGEAEYVGEVIDKTDAKTRLNPVNALLRMSGIWEPSDEIREVDTACCRFFLTKAAASDACDEVNDRLFQE